MGLPAYRYMYTQQMFSNWHSFFHPTKVPLMVCFHVFLGVPFFILHFAIQVLAILVYTRPNSMRCLFVKELSPYMDLA